MTGLIIVGCGGGTYDSQQNSSSVEQNISGTVHSITQQSYVVYYDANENGRLDEGETATLSDTQGNYSFTITPSKSTAIIVASPASDNNVSAQEMSTTTRGLGDLIHDVSICYKTITKYDPFAGSNMTLRQSMNSGTETHIGYLSSMTVELMEKLDANTTYNSDELLYNDATKNMADLLNISSDKLYTNPELDTETHSLNTKLEALEVLLYESFKHENNNSNALSDNTLLRQANSTATTVSRQTVRKAILSSLQKHGNGAWSDISTVIDDVDNAFETDITTSVKNFIGSQVNSISDFMDGNDSVSSKKLHMADLLPKAVQRIQEHNSSSSTEISTVQKQRVYMAISGGGWNTHSATAGWLMGALSALKNEEKNGTMAELTQNVEAISCNSGGCWFTSHIAFSQQFLEEIQSTDINEYNTTGYLGQIKNIFTDTSGQYYISLPTDPTIPEIPDSGIAGTMSKYLTEFFVNVGPYDTYLNNAVKFTSWYHTMNFTAFSPLDLNETSHQATLGNDDSALEWAKDKSIIFSTALNTNAYIGEYNETVIETPSLMDRFLGDELPTITEASYLVSYSATFVNNSDVPTQVNSSPVLLTKLATQKRNHIKPPVFLAGDVSLTYTDTEPYSAEALGTINRNISTDSLSVFNAASNSSSAGGAAATVNSEGSSTFYLQDAASGYIVDTTPGAQSISSTFNAIVSGVIDADYYTSVGSNTNYSNKIRMNDGGYIDNTSVAYLIKFLQTNKLDDNFKIVLFMNSSSTDLMVKGDTNLTCTELDENASAHPDSFCVVSDVARLFVDSNTKYPVKSDGTTSLVAASSENSVESSFKFKLFEIAYYASKSMINDIETLISGDGVASEVNGLVQQFATTMSANVFDNQSWESGKVVWSTPMDNNYTASYVVFDVETVENKSFGITAGSKGELHIFASNKTDSSAAPGLAKVTTDVLNAYNVILSSNFNNVKSDELWPHFKRAFNLTD